MKTRTIVIVFRDSNVIRRHELSMADLADRELRAAVRRWDLGGCGDAEGTLLKIEDRLGALVRHGKLVGVEKGASLLAVFM